jgi:hypothetical protein
MTKTEALRIDLAGEFTGKKAFNAAERAVGNLEKKAGNLAKTLGIALGVGVVAAFGKASVKAFMEDEKSAALLANTVKNLGKELELPSIEKFIANMESATGIADDELRPAMQKLLTTFKDTADAQSMLALATEVSRGSGQDLATVVADLTKAASGQTKGLEKYKLGLTAAELKTMSFEEIMQKLNKQFKGSNAAYLETYAGKLETLKTAAGNAQEIIGKGLVDALIALTGAVDVQDLATKLIGFAQNLANAFVTIGNIIGENIAFVKTLGAVIIGVFTAAKVYAGALAFIKVIKEITKFLKIMREVSIAAAIAQMAAINPVAALVGGAALLATIYAANEALDALTTPSLATPSVIPNFAGLDDPKYKKFQADQIKAAKISAKIEADKLKLQKASMLFDMSKIQLIAALKGNLSKEERDRLELQLALETENTTEVTRLTGQIAKAQGLSIELTNYLKNLPAASNPFVAWKGYLDDLELQAKRIAALKLEAPVTNVPTQQGNPNGMYDYTPQSPSFVYDPPVVQVTVAVDGEEIAGKITKVQTNGYLSGKILALERLQSQFG